jgi:hypothetical protein
LSLAFEERWTESLSAWKKLLYFLQLLKVNNEEIIVEKSGPINVKGNYNRLLTYQ